MPNTVYKYGPVVPNVDVQEIVMPRGAGIVHMMEQPHINGQLYLWAVVNPQEKETERRRFAVLGTGWDIPPYLYYVCTCMACDGTVWHLFEEYPVS